jgi:hypothetical protein
MGKRQRKHNRKARHQSRAAQNPTVLQQPRFAFATKVVSVFRRFPGWLWAMIAAGGVLLGYGTLYPTLSINQDYSFDNMNPFNTSFSIVDEGYWPLRNLSAVCEGDFTMRPWTTNPDDKSSMHLHTADSAPIEFAKDMRFKERLTLPCNHNVVANGHKLDPGATLKITVTYRFGGTKMRRSQVFHFRTVMGWGGQAFWQYAG